MELKDIDTKEGLENCGQSEEIYCIVLKSVYEEGHEKLSLLRNFYDTGQYGQYGVVAHGLKSVAKTIGAHQLARLARDQEEAARNNDYEFIRCNKEKFLEAYESLLKELARCKMVMEAQ